ncbi:Myosin heavy chain 95F [Temnothorax longispinosus]|uniref:Myosin heavy chain 95F n=1 Tax=Temnothorax longispinosus TaxID=300112 RepID=A0A4S2L1P4_9HYME|nr:Myosin heavy chain 95F [Temnothorax longispinosus]
MWEMVEWDKRLIQKALVNLKKNSIANSVWLDAYCLKRGTFVEVLVSRNDDVDTAVQWRAYVGLILIDQLHVGFCAVRIVSPRPADCPRTARRVKLGMENQQVWVRDPQEAFIIGKFTDMVDGDALIVPLDPKYPQRTYPLDEVHPAGEYTKDIEDNCALMYLSE